MQWFYARNGQQAGPVNEADFERLAREGVIQPDTLVWRDGMAQWQPLANVALSPQPPSLPGTLTANVASGDVVCGECGKLVSAGETVQIGAATICAACKSNYVQKLREGAVKFTPAVGEVRYAGFWVRLGAYTIDQVIQMIITVPLNIWVSVRMQTSIQTGALNWRAIATDYSIVTSVGLLVAVLYGWLFVGRYGATPGKMLMHIKVVRADGTRVSYGLSLGRQLAEIVSSIPCMLGYLFVAFDEQKRALHDFMCNTRVVYK